jgi:hypothetical protein
MQGSCISTAASNPELWSPTLVKSSLRCIVKEIDYIYRSWTAIVDQFKAVNEQTFFLMSRTKLGYQKFDQVCALIFQHFDLEISQAQQVSNP